MWIEIRPSQTKCWTESSCSSFEVVCVSSESRRIGIGIQSASVLRNAHASQAQKRQMEDVLNKLKAKEVADVQETVLNNEDPLTLIATLEKRLRAQPNTSVTAPQDLTNIHYRHTRDEDEDLQFPTDLEFLTGKPKSLEVQALRFLQCGVSPSYPALASILKVLTSGKAESKDESKIYLNNGRCAYIIVDSWGLLKPGEIFMKFSVRCFRA